MCSSRWILSPSFRVVEDGKRIVEGVEAERSVGRVQVRVGAGHGCLEGAGDELDGFSFQELAPISRAPRNVKVKDESAKLNFILPRSEAFVFRLRFLPRWPTFRNCLSLTGPSFLPRISASISARPNHSYCLHARTRTFRCYLGSALAMPASHVWKPTRDTSDCSTTTPERSTTMSLKPPLPLHELLHLAVLRPPPTSSGAHKNKS